MALDLCNPDYRFQTSTLSDLLATAPETCPNYTRVPIALLENPILGNHSLSHRSRAVTPSADELFSQPISYNSPESALSSPITNATNTDSFPAAIYKYQSGSNASEAREGGPSRTSPNSMIRTGSFSQTSRLKLYKACNFCRRRKIKCRKLSGSVMCEKCDELQQDCIFEPKRLSDRSEYLRGKRGQNSYFGHRRRRSMAIDEDISFDLEDFDAAFGSMESDEDFQRYFSSSTDNGQTPTAAIKAANRSILKVYIDSVEPYTPFVALEVLSSKREDELSKLAKCCINIASVSSPSTIVPESTLDLFLDIVRDLILGNVDRHCLLDMSCMLLLPLRTRIDRTIISEILVEFGPILEEKGYDLSPGVNLGLLTIDAFNSLLTNTPLLIDARTLKNTTNHLQSLDNDQFCYHFLSIGAFLYKFLWLTSSASSASSALTPQEKKYELIRLEYDILLWPAKLTAKFHVVKDNLLATSEAFILHVLHNTLLIAFYRNAVVNKSTYGKMSSVLAMPGLYHFLSAIAKSTFKIKSGVVGRWPLITDCQILTAKYLLDLFKVMEFHDFKKSLQWFKVEDLGNSSYHDSFPTVLEDVKTLLDGETYTEDPDGAMVFWVFRDVRSMSLEVYLHDENYRRGSGVDPDIIYTGDTVV